jgi:hypothetical protein
LFLRRLGALGESASPGDSKALDDATGLRRHGTRGGGSVRTQQRVHRETGNIVAALLRAASGDDPESCRDTSAALIHCVTHVAAAVGPAAPHGPGPRSTAPSDPPPPKPSVNDKSVDRRLPDATLQAHLTHVPESARSSWCPRTTAAAAHSHHRPRGLHGGP